MFSIEMNKFYWIDDSTDNPDDLCLHGDVVVNIGNECFEESCTISATALYLLKSLTENHIIHADNQMLPCCGHFYIPNDSNDTVDISGCPSGIDWTVLHVGGGIEITTEQGIKTLLEIRAYEKIVYDFADTIQSIYEKCSPKIVPKDDFHKKGYVAFWNEWLRRRNNLSDAFFCPATSRTIDGGLCWEYCFANNGGPKDTTKNLKNWISDTHIYKNIKNFHTVCDICFHCQWSK